MEERRRPGPEPAARDFLVGLAQALSVRRLYGSTHPRTGTALAVAVDAARRLLERAPAPVLLTLLGSEVILGREPLSESGPEGWAERLSKAGIQRIELREPPTAEEMVSFLSRLERVLRGEPAPPLDPEAPHRGALVFGGLRPQAEASAPPSAPPPAASVGRGGDDLEGTAPSPPPLEVGEELQALTWIWDEVGAGRPLPLAEAEGVVRSLSVLLREIPPRTAFRVGGEEVAPAGEVPGPWGYRPLHGLHTGALVMAWVRDLGVSHQELLDLGFAGLLHDLGFANSAPAGLLDHPGALGAEGRAAVERHPVEGARILLATHARLALAAVVAFEHHLLPGGGGYPASSRVGVPHPAARLVQLLSAYSALRLPRPHRGARAPASAREVIRAQAGTTFDADLVADFDRIEAEYPAVATPPREDPAAG